MSANIESRFQERMTECFLPIFRASPPSLPEHEGTGVLVGTSSANWLVTAAHVLTIVPGSEFLLPGNPSLFPLYGEIFSTSELTRAATSSDRLDIAFLKLNEANTRNLISAGMKFCSTEPEAILTEHRDLADQLSYIGGFTEKSIDVDAESLIARGQPFVFQGAVVSDSKMKLCGYDKTRHIGIRYRQVVSPDGKPMKRPNPKGMSGGPIWVLDAGVLRLAGVVIEFDEAKSMIIGVRTLNLFQAIERHSRYANNRFPKLSRSGTTPDSIILRRHPRSTA